MTNFEPLVVVIYRDRKNLLGAALADDVFIEHFENFMGYGQAAVGILPAFVDFLADDVVTQVDAFVADEYGGACNQLSHLVLAFAAK